MGIASIVAKDLASAHYLIKRCITEVKNLCSVDSRAVRVNRVGLTVLLCLIYLLISCNYTNSLTLTAFTHLLVFDFMSVFVAIVSLWTKKKTASLAEYTLGYERFEVVAVFSATILTILLSFFELKEAVERIFEPDEVNPTFMIIPCIVAFGIHVLVVYGVDNPAYAHVFQACGSSWLQEHTTDISRTICRIIPCLSRILLPRVNPIALIGVSSTSVVCLVYALMLNHPATQPGSEFPDPLSDTLGAILISLMFIGTMIPMTMYSGRILLQTTPAHLVGPLDKALREASTVDGVLELKNEHFWSIGFADLAGSLYVRVRRDANEQLVLAHVTNRLCSLVKYLTIQVYKDDWTRASNTFNIQWPPTQTTIPMQPPLGFLQRDEIKS